MQETIQSFVREILGCNCPPEVFEQIKMDFAAPLFDGLPHEVMIDIGSRLLVLLVRVDDGMALQDLLSGYFRRGRQYRDEKGFNRFRLVVACNNAESTMAALENRLRAIEIDERVHLHVLPQAVVPEFKAEPA